jgi:hypothetical protein
VDFQADDRFVAHACLATEGLVIGVSLRV